jgi:deoxycytidylate deaminase
LKDEVPDVAGKEEDLRLHLTNNFKILDLYRALHAEENAIVNLAKNGNSVSLVNFSHF